MRFLCNTLNLTLTAISTQHFVPGFPTFFTNEAPLSHGWSGNDQGDRWVGQFQPVGKMSFMKIDPARFPYELAFVSIFPIPINQDKGHKPPWMIMQCPIVIALQNMVQFK